MPHDFTFLEITPEMDINDNFLKYLWSRIKRYSCFTSDSLKNSKIQKIYGFNVDIKDSGIPQSLYLPMASVLPSNSFLALAGGGGSVLRLQCMYTKNVSGFAWNTWNQTSNRLYGISIGQRWRYFKELSSRSSVPRDLCELFVLYLVVAKV
ncbi:hypothetical protein M422DRAFT_42221 [Sphaerobolus stellatus SS14]|nr:hypothetical protein M422DRAFT_42221 [Sphaerobolus stellatus SS14]